MQNIVVVGGAVSLAVLAVLVYVCSAAALWLRAMFSGCPVGFANIIFMRLRKLPPKEIVGAKIMAAKAGLDLATDELEAHCLAGGSPMRVARALIAAGKAGAPLSFEQAAAADLADAIKRV